MCNDDNIRTVVTISGSDNIDPVIVISGSIPNRSKYITQSMMSLLLPVRRQKNI